MRDLAKRMKDNYENRQRFYLTRRMPVIIRVDGRAFHTVTRKLDKPFSAIFIDVMQRTAHSVAEGIQGCKLAYVQSDEVSFLLTDYDSLQTEAWFDYNLSKMVSVAAAHMSVIFNLWFPNRGMLLGDTIVFDARAFNVPREEVANYFLWRAKDWSRNSVQMYAQSFFSHKQLLNKGIPEIHEMLHDIGKNWTNDLPPHLKNGWWRVGEEWQDNILPTYESVNAVVEPLVNPPKDERTEPCKDEISLK